MTANSQQSTTSATAATPTTTATALTGTVNMTRIETELMANPTAVAAAVLLERIGRAHAELSEIRSALHVMTQFAPAERDLVLQQVQTGAGAKAFAQVETASAHSVFSTTKKLSNWKPRAATMQVIKLMQQGLSNDDIAARKDIEVENNAANLRQIRKLARQHGLLAAPRTDERDSP